MSRVIHLAISDFQSDFKWENSYFNQILSKKYSFIVEEDFDKADYLVYSVFGSKHQKFKGIKIFLTGENYGVFPREFDLGFGFDFGRENEFLFRLPIYVMISPKTGINGQREKINVRNLNERHTRIPSDEEFLSSKSKFCNFLYSNPSGKERNKLFEKLSQYKAVDSGGRFRNNIGRRIENKIKFLEDYKFTIAFENTFTRGYVSEKLFEPILANSLPIYGGSDWVHKDVNPKVLINAADYNSIDKLVERIIEIDNNDSLYMSHFRNPIFENSQYPDFWTQDWLMDKFDYIFDSSIKPKVKVYSFGFKVRSRVVHPIVLAVKKLLGFPPNKYGYMRKYSAKKRNLGNK